MLIYIVRHGTTEWNSEHKIQGRTDIMLDSLGREMARQTGERFKELGITFDRIYSSPLKRAYETARLIVDPEYRQDPESTEIEKSDKIIIDKRLRELSFGRQEGQHVESMMLDITVPFRYFKSNPDKYDELTIHDSDTESLSTLCERAAEFLKENIESAGDNAENSGENAGSTGKTTGCKANAADEEKILISGHGALNKALLMNIRRMPGMHSFWGDGLQPNCGIDIVRFDPETKKYEILESNRTYYEEKLKSMITQLL